MVDAILLLAALVGHVLIWIGVLNRSHGTAMPRWMIDAITLACFALIGLIPLGFAAWFARVGWTVVDRNDWSAHPLPLAYLGISCLAAAFGIGIWARRVMIRPPSILRWQRRRSLKLDKPAAHQVAEGHLHHFLVHLPGNEMLDLDLNERAFELAHLPPALAGFSIVHLSDLHFTGKIGKAYFRDVIAMSNLLEPDLVALTGDLVDTNSCIDWIPELLGELKGRYGSYFILGNHDLEVDVRRLRQTLTASGLVDLGGRWKEVPVGDSSIVLAGNELPWLPPAADMETAPPPAAEGGPLRFLLSHSPDQISWAQFHQFDLMLAGHTHGGQIRFPLIGALLTPSLAGVKYASGLFYASPTVMHVSRGVSGLFPVRMNCPPEMAKLILHGPPEH